MSPETWVGVDTKSILFSGVVKKKKKNEENVILAMWPPARVMITTIAKTIIISICPYNIRKLNWLGL